MNEKDSHHAMFWDLLQLMYQGKHRVYEIAEEYKLTVMQASAIIMLSPDEPKPMRTFSDYFMCDASTVTGVIDRLEKSGLISRQDHPSDRRITLIALTPHGTQLKKELLSRTEAAEAERFNNVLNESERQTLHSLIGRLIDSPIEPIQNK
ncbi:MAG: MarR family transcriptional regulator [Candidatus Saccharimonadales bacterium]